jgi:hypothetical protein
MQTAHSARPVRQGLVILDKTCGEIQLTPGRRLVNLRKPSTLIAVTLRSKKKNRHNNTCGIISFSLLKYSEKASLPQPLSMAIPTAHASAWVDERALKALSTQSNLKALLELELLHGAIGFLVSAGANRC